MGMPLSARAQTRPLQTEEALSSPAGTLVLETGLEAIRGEPNFLTGRSRTRGDGPLLRLVYSPADRVELDLEWVTKVWARNDPDFGSVSDWGDVSLRAKLRFRDASGGSPAVGARFGVSLPETSFGNGLGPNVLRMFAEALITQPIGRARLHANAGLFLHDEVLRPHEQRDFLSYGLALERPAGRLTLLAEVAGRAGNGQPGAEERAEARAGFRYGRGRLRADAAVRRGLSDSVGEWGLTAGLTWIVRAP
jgi:hypothetical protein